MSRLVAVDELTVRTEHIGDLVLVQIHHVLTGLAAVLTRVEVFWVFIECLANTSGEGETRVGVDVDLADSTLGSPAELILWNTDSIWQFTAVLVDDVNILLWNRRRTVENDWEAGKLLLDGCENVKCQWRRNETAGLRVTCTLLRSEFVSTVRSTDGDSQRVAACAGREVYDLFRLGVVRNLRCDLVLNTGKYTQLCLDSDVVLMSILNNLLGQCDILLLRKS